jgi:hypothetical protein
VSAGFDAAVGDVGMGGCTVTASGYAAMTRLLMQLHTSELSDTASSSSSTDNSSSSNGSSSGNNSSASSISGDTSNSSSSNGSSSGSSGSASSISGDISSSDNSSSSSCSSSSSSNSTKIVLALEGGYALRSLKRCAAACCKVIIITNCFEYFSKRAAMHCHTARS